MVPTSPAGAGEREIPQFPATTVVTPWLTFGDMSGPESISRSSCVCASMKPGAAIFPEASISTSALAASSPPIRAMRSPRTPISPAKRGAPVPSMMVALRMSRSKCSMSSVQFRAGALDDFGPARPLPPAQIEKLRGRPAVRVGVEFRESLAHGGRLQRGDNFTMQFFHDFRGKMRRPDDPPPGDRLITRNTRFRNGGYVGKQRRTPRAGNRERPDASGFGKRRDRGHVIEDHMR